jgi:hypothetical protein
MFNVFLSYGSIIFAVRLNLDFVDLLFIDYQIIDLCLGGLSKILL